MMAMRRRAGPTSWASPARATAVPNARVAESLEGVQGLGAALSAKGQCKVLPYPRLRVEPVAPRPRAEHGASLDRPKIGRESDRRIATVEGGIGHFVSISFPARVIRRT